MSNQFELPFENRYRAHYSKIYYFRHKKGFLRRLSNYLEQQMIAKSLQLAEKPKVVLDLPCGAGRFIDTIIKSGVEKIIAADKSENMLNVIKEFFPSDVLKKIELLQTSITHIDLPDKSVDNILCIRLIHHIPDVDYRRAIYKEIRRVSRKTACITYWVDGNYKSYLEKNRASSNKELSRCLNVAYLENELVSSGFSIIGYVDMIKWFHYWRSYVLKV